MLIVTFYFRKGVIRERRALSGVFPLLERALDSKTG
jgi:hypothetical protein